MAAIQRAFEDDFNIIEQHLRDYYVYKTGLKNLKQHYDRMFPKITTAFRLSEGSPGSLMFHSDTEDYAIDRAELSKSLEREILLYENVISSIENALKTLDELELQFVEYRYFKAWTIEQMTPKLQYSRRGIYSIRDRVKAKLIINLRNLIIY